MEPNLASLGSNCISYEKLTAIIESASIPAKNKIHFICEAMMFLKVTFLDLINLLPLGARYRLFESYNRDQSAFVSFFQRGVGSDDESHSSFVKNEFLFAPTKLDGLTPKISCDNLRCAIHLFFYMYVLPSCMSHDKALDIKQIIRNMMNIDIQQSQNLSQDDIFTVELLQEFYIYFEKILRKQPSNLDQIQSVVNQIRVTSPQDQEKKDQLLDLKVQQRDIRILTYYLSKKMKKLLYLYLQHEENGLSQIKDFEKYEYRKLVAQSVTSLLEEGQNIQPITDLFQVLFNNMVQCQHRVMTLKYGIMILRLFDTVVKEAQVMDLQVKSIIKFQNKTVFWRIVKVLLFSNRGALCTVILNYMYRNFSSLFGFGQLFYGETKQYIILLFCFLYIYNESCQYINQRQLQLENGLEQVREGKQMAFKLIDLLRHVEKQNDLFNEQLYFVNLVYNQAEVDSLVQKELFPAQQEHAELLAPNQGISKLIKSTSINWGQQLPEQCILILAFIKRVMMMEYTENMLLEENRYQFNRAQLQILYQNLLLIPTIEDSMKATMQQPEGYNNIYIVKNELLFECFGLIGAFKKIDINGFQHQYLIQKESISQLGLQLNMPVSQFSGRLSGNMSAAATQSKTQLSQIQTRFEYLKRDDNNIIQKVLMFINENYLSIEIPFKAIISTYGNLKNLERSKSQITGKKQKQLTQTLLDQFKVQIKEENPNEFIMAHWLFHLAQSCTQISSEQKVALLACLELLSSSNLALKLAPWILYHYLNQLQEEQSFKNFAAKINMILEQDNLFRKYTIMTSLEILESWYKEDLSQKEQKLITYDMNKNLLFIKNFQNLSQSLPPKLLSKVYIQLSEHKKAIQTLEKMYHELDFRRKQCAAGKDLAKLAEVKQQIAAITCQLSRIYRQINEDYNNINIIELMEKEQMEPELIQKLRTEQLQLREDKLSEAIYEDAPSNAQDREGEFMRLYKLSNILPTFGLENEKSELKIYQYFRNILWGFAQFMQETSEINVELYRHLIFKAINKIKKALFVNLFNSYDHYDVKFHFFVHVQFVTHLEIIFTILQFIKQNQFRQDLLVENYQLIVFDSTQISLDPLHRSYLLKLRQASPQPSAGNGASGALKQLNLNLGQMNVQLVQNCLRYITDISLKNFDIHYQQGYYIRVIYKYVYYLIKQGLRQYEIQYLKFIGKLAFYTFKNKYYEQTLKYLKKIKANKKLWDSDTKVKILKARTYKKLGNYKKAVNILEKIALTDKNVEIWQIAKTKQMIYLYRSNMYDNNKIIDEFKKLITSQKFYSEKCYFKLAVMMEETYQIKDIEQRFKTIKYYQGSILQKNSYRYIQESLPRLLKLWLDLQHQVIAEQSKKEQNKNWLGIYQQSTARPHV